LGEEFFQILEQSDVQTNSSEPDIEFTENGKRTHLMSSNASSTIESVNVIIFLNFFDNEVNKQKIIYIIIRAKMFFFYIPKMKR